MWSLGSEKCDPSFVIMQMIRSYIVTVVGCRLDITFHGKWSKNGSMVTGGFFLVLREDKRTLKQNTTHTRGALNSAKEQQKCLNNDKDKLFQ